MVLIGLVGLPLVGNLIDMPCNKERATFAHWGKEYGDIASVSILGQCIVIVNSAQVAIDMLDKKSSIFSDRLVLVMKALGLTPYGARFRDYHRRAYQLFENNAAMKQFLPPEELETRRLLKRLLVKPEDLSTPIRRTTGAISLRIIYGYEVQEEEDLFVELAEQDMHQFSLSVTSGRFLVNLIPSCKSLDLVRYVPDWFPGAEFKRIAKMWASTRSDLGGVDTTAASIYAFFKAMVLFPEVQVKAQAEIDAVVGIDRLPGFDDRERLPYINALVLEVSRWHSVVPTGVPHRVTEDDVHSGYFIPKGTIVFANIWYGDISSPKGLFGTENKEPELDPYKVSFGFGRRVLADASIFHLLCYGYCEDGIVFEPDTETTSGTVSHPALFKCTIKPRNEKGLFAASTRRES
ncbi:cytochrome P450 [Armillaria novae-zelandiae]|uniref:Cytochrome P450 n=1 Tax=Armillaria novae-zelandiae TaxID=153914 RepID=A0AA39P975_9AGAR|nr:cytochrome P450 [Armillaria novae-zelandiae]